MRTLQAAPDQTAISKHKEAVAEHGARLADLEKATAERDEVEQTCCGPSELYLSVALVSDAWTDDIAAPWA